MRYFADEQEVYSYIGRLFQDVADDETLVPELQRANTIAQFRTRDPDSVITVKLLDGEPRQVDLGPTALEPEIVMITEADVAHRFWLGKVNVTVALAKGQIRARGPVAKILRLVPLVKPLFPRYRDRLEAAGRDDLLDV